MRRIMAGIGCAAAAMAAPAGAGHPILIEMKCPVGGKRFNHTSTQSYSIWGSRPDGKPYGSWDFPMPLPVCPDNRLPIYKDFSAQEVRKLRPLIRSPEYREMRERETSYYAAYWLMTRLGEPLEDRMGVLLQAIWEADWHPELKRRYQVEFVELAGEMAEEPDRLDWLVGKGRAANALRELGRFDEAAALLASLPTSSLDVEVPAEKYGEATASGLGRQLLNFSEVAEARRRRGWLDYLKDLQAVVARRDASSAPLDMLPERAAIERCAAPPPVDAAAALFLPPLSDFDKSWCDREEVREQVALMKKRSAQ